MENNPNESNTLPRISVEVTPEIKNFLNKHFRYGEQRQIICIFITTLIEECVREGSRRPISRYIQEALDHHKLLASYKETNNHSLKLHDFTLEERRELGQHKGSE